MNGYSREQFCLTISPNRLAYQQNHATDAQDMPPDNKTTETRDTHPASELSKLGIPRTCSLQT